jgi:hypothetical protein
MRAQTDNITITAKTHQPERKKRKARKKSNQSATNVMEKKSLDTMEFQRSQSVNPRMDTTVDTEHRRTSTIAENVSVGDNDNDTAATGSEAERWKLKASVPPVNPQGPCEHQRFEHEGMTETGVDRDNGSIHSASSESYKAKTEDLRKLLY